VVNALVKAQLGWGKTGRSGPPYSRRKDTCPRPLAAIERAFTHYDHEHYGPSGAIRHPEWGSARIDFVPYPYPSYTEALVRFLQDTYVEGERAFLARLDPKEAHGRLVDDTFVRKALDQVGGLAAFGLPNEWTRTEVISLWGSSCFALEEASPRCGRPRWGWRWPSSRGPSSRRPSLASTRCWGRFRRRDPSKPWPGWCKSSGRGPTSSSACGGWR